VVTGPEGAGEGTPVSGAVEAAPSGAIEATPGPGAEAALYQHPGPLEVALPGRILGAMIAHARAGYPNEACGIVVGDRPAAEGGRALRFEPTRNAVASPYRYEVHPADLLRLTLQTEDVDESFWAIIHSHVRSPARPSPTDIGAATYPDALYILVSLSEAQADAATGEPSARAWRILDGAIHEVALRVEG
jgi:[CysO sulfur-carrier protein]-S-L-cysteine hydrolase